MLILVGISLWGIFGENGLINNTKEAAFKTEFKKYQEETNMYVLAERIRPEFLSSNINAGEDAPEPKIEIKKIIQTLKEENRAKVEVADGEFYYVPINIKSNETKREVKWCFEVNIKVKGYNSYEDFLEETEIVKVSDGTYKEVGGVYCCSPDLTGFNYKTTRYVTWDENGKELIGTTINKEPPPDWYNYKDKKWANVITSNDGKEAYFVWIPRYAYKLDQTTQTADIKFVDKVNTYKDYDTNETTLYADTEPKYDESGTQINYYVPEEFKWGEDGNYTELAGYWVSKYEVSDAIELEAQYVMTENKITIQDVKSKYDNNKISSYDVYMDGQLKGNTTTFPYDIGGLEPNSEHYIRLEVRDSNGNIIGFKPEEMIKTLERPIKELTRPDLTGFNPDTTYYVTYDASGNETRTSIKGTPPTDWYDYSNKKWANIVSSNNGKEAYFVWIPKYEYKLRPMHEEVLIRFVKKEQEGATGGYILPEEFKWGEDGNYTELAGYWVSKYEVSDVIELEAQYVMTENKITIQDVKSKYDNNKISSYDVYMDGQLKGNTTTFPYDIGGLEPNSEHYIRLEMRDSNGNIIGFKSEEMIKTLERPIKELTRPDLTGFNLDTTYYVTYDASGNETRTSIKGTPPTDWYDYSNKKWANIVSSNNGKEAYFVWIPKYEYKLRAMHEEVLIRFIKKEQEGATGGYILPEEFKWGEDGNYTNLAGYWVGKYEVSE